VKAIDLILAAATAIFGVLAIGAGLSENTGVTISERKGVVAIGLVSVLVATRLASRALGLE